MQHCLWTEQKFRQNIHFYSLLIFHAFLNFSYFNVDCFCLTGLWLSICFVIFLFHSDFRPTSLEKGQELVRLRIYQVYAWGVPLIITSVAAILDILPVTPDDGFLRPRFGENNCWFAGRQHCPLILQWKHLYYWLIALTIQPSLVDE